MQLHPEAVAKQQEGSQNRGAFSVRQTLSLEQLSADAIRANPRNARTHDVRQIDQIAASIRAFGFTIPVLIDEIGVIIIGHGRVAAAENLGLSEVPATRIAHLSEPEKRALMWADNRIALNAGWDIEILAAELADLSAAVDLDFDLTGFDIGEIDVIPTGAGQTELDEPEIAPTPDPRMPAITGRGDIWQSGPHRIMCEDALSADDLDGLMRADLADHGFVAPPYNVPIQGDVTGKGQVQHREFLQGSGEMSAQGFATFRTDALSNAAQASRDGAVWFGCIDWRHMREMNAAGARAFGKMLNLCVRAKKRTAVWGRSINRSTNFFCLP